MMSIRTTPLLVVALAGSLVAGCASSAEDTRAHDGREAVLVVHQDGAGGPPVRAYRVRSGPGDDDVFVMAPGVARVAPRVQIARTPTLRLEQDGSGVLPLMLARSGPMLGVMVETSPDGLRVTSVEPDTLAEAAGVQAGDVILSVGDTKVKDVADVRAGLDGVEPGDTVKVSVVRADAGLVELQGVMPERKGTMSMLRRNAPLTDGSRGGFLGVELDDWQADGPHARHEAGDDDDAGDAADDDGAADAAPDAATEDEPGRKQGPGVWIAGVVPDSAAWYAGLERGDRLLAIDGDEIADNQALVGAVSSRKPGTMVELKILRDGQEKTLSTRLGGQRMASPLGFLRQPGGDLDLFGVPGDAMPRLRSLRMPQGGALHLDPDAFGGDLHDLMQDLHLKMLEGDGDHSVKVTIEDGEMTIVQDGETTRYVKDDQGDWVPAPSADEPTDAAEDDGPRER